MRYISSLMIWFSILSLLSLLTLALTYCVLRLQALYQENQEGSEKSLLEVKYLKGVDVQNFMLLLLQTNECFN